ncbi:HesA/MoeB/ThiF family protein [Brevibacillus dissolubilis]|uniref:HesA/MoeB/ThiF family protein n=1 Tax=Brevibacillus dissolubilis TaxID=1844116 RepID=UPI002100182D|nr:ThiF family adenylyltransferase [Brevibacillus dissolubilis]
MGELAGVAVELEDPDGSIRKLVSLMDGSRTIPELHQAMLAHYPNLTLEEITEAVQTIDELGFLYDYTKDQSIPLDETQRERYKANMRYYALESNLANPPSVAQQKVCNSRVTILGMGAFGSCILACLAGLGVEHIRIVDFDRIDLSNLNRQILFAEENIGELKVDVAKSFVNRFNSTVHIETIVLELDSVESIEEVIVGSDMVILAADQPFHLMQRWANIACVNQNIPYIGGGVLLTTGTLFTIIPGVTNCADCTHLHRINLTPDYVDILEAGVINNHIPPTATPAPNLMMVAGMIASEAMRFLSGTGELQSAGKVIYYNMETFEKFYVEEIERDVENCPTCGNGDPDQRIFRLLEKDAFHERRVVKRA